MTNKCYSFLEFPLQPIDAEPLAGPYFRQGTLGLLLFAGHVGITPLAQDVLNFLFLIEIVIHMHQEFAYSKKKQEFD